MTEIKGNVVMVSWDWKDKAEAADLNVAQRLVPNGIWYSVDLSHFGGQSVEIIFEALPGPAGDVAYDWGGWSTPVLVDETLPAENDVSSTVPP